MMHGNLRTAVLLAAVLATGGTARAQSSLDDDFDRGSIVIEASTSACYPFEVYLALTDGQQRRGLMHVRNLPPRTGMLFVYGSEAPRSMWMKNTYLPLDILFIRADGTIASIATQTEPLSERSIPSGEPVRYVLELNAGVTAELGIDTDSTVTVPHLTP